MSNEYLIRVPRKRLGVLIGSNGEVKKQIEDLTECELQIDSQSGDVIIVKEEKEEIENPIVHMQAREVVKAIARGFNPQKALTIAENDNQFMLINLRDRLGNSPNLIRTVKARIIGAKGRTRRYIENATGAYISVYGNTIGIIGSYEQMEIAREAIERLIGGAKHGSVYAFINKKIEEIKRNRSKLWINPNKEEDKVTITDLDQLERIVFEEEDEAEQEEDEE